MTHTAHFAPRRIDGFALLAILILLAVALLQGCAQLGIAPADTFNKKAAVAIATVTEVRETATAALQAGKITPDQARDVQAKADAARDGIQAARQVAAQGDYGSAQTRLDAIQATLQALHTYLIQRQTAPRN